jgi:hypothetical protein
MVSVQDTHAQANSLIHTHTQISGLVRAALVFHLSLCELTFFGPASKCKLRENESSLAVILTYVGLIFFDLGVTFWL